jgi:GT2 family glycosyltransferase
MMRIAVLVTVFNRVDVTVRGLKKFSALAEQMNGDFEFSIFLVDDGSTDGTGSRVRELPLDVKVIEGTGSLYWNRGMALAYDAVRQSGKRFDAYMLYNDDVELNASFVDFVRQFRELDSAILVGAFCDAATGDVTYSGFERVGRLRPLAFSKVALTDTLVPIDTFNGNAVLIPAQAFEALGGLDPGYTHAYGDLDLGLRAKSIGIHSFVYGTPIGLCERGVSIDDRVKVAKLGDRWKLLFGHPHGLNSYVRFARKHGNSALVPFYAIHETIRRARKLFS